MGAAGTDETRLAACRAELGEEDFKSITRAKVEFSQSGFSALEKRLTAESLNDAKAKKQLLKLREAVSEYFEFQDGKPQIKVEALN